MKRLCIILKFAKKKNIYPLDFIRCINAARKMEAQTPQEDSLGNETSIITITEAPSAASNVYFVVNAGRITSAR